MVDAYPLTWPVGYDRTHPGKRIPSNFKITAGRAMDEVRREVQKISGTSNNKLVISCNLRVKSNGGFYADELARKIDEPGVAIYFQYKGNMVSLCCDQYLTPADNLWALCKTIDALRGIDSWGVSDFLNRTFTGFKELPEAKHRDCWDILGIAATKDVEAISKAYKLKAKESHPDAGGSNSAFIEVKNAYLEAIHKAENF